MDEPAAKPETLSRRANRLARRLLVIGENRLALLAVKLQEESGRLLKAIALALGAAILALMAAITLTAAIAVVLWDHYPTAVLLILATLYATASACLARRLRALQRDCRILAATLEQLRKDRTCFEDTTN